MTVADFWLAVEWLLSSPLRCLLALVAWLALVGIVATVRHFLRWLFN